MTSEAHTSGTARIAEVLETLSINDKQIIVNVQGDEPIVQHVYQTFH
jgi:3-deoxy-manno-octulosonate cytidylyltransferase (CMP-KDO synthetase)